MRTATVVSLAAVLLGVGWMGISDDEVQINPERVAVASGQPEVAGYFPAQFEIQPDPSEPEVYEYY